MTSMTMLNNNSTTSPHHHHQDSLYLPTSSPSSSLHHYTSSSTSPPTRTIAPKLTTSFSHHHHRYTDSPPDLLRCKKRIIELGQLPSSAGKGGPQPAAVARRNERERNRVRLVNLGFATLRQHVPASTKNKKMSKVDTLKSAVEYIKRLQELLGETSMDENAYPGVGRSGQSSTGSPTPSMCSEASSPYDVTHGEEEEELMDFANWF